jgi:alpha-ribazole phosphatase
MKPWNEISQEYQEEWGKDFINCKVHGGEIFFDVQERIIHFWEQVTPANDKEILVVTHAGLLRALLSHLLDASPRKILPLT